MIPAQVEKLESAGISGFGKGGEERQVGAKPIFGLRVMGIELSGSSNGDRSGSLPVDGKSIRPRGRCGTEDSGKNEGCDSYLHLSVLRYS